MSTVARGKVFEQRVFAALGQELQAGGFGIVPSNAQIYFHKAYYSADRKADITFDIAIEVFFSNRQKPSLLLIFECKDYKGHVPVNDLEEFHAKLQQIGADNTKGIFVTSGALQAGARAYAESMGIGIVRLLPSDQIEFVVDLMVASNWEQRSEVKWSEFHAALSNPHHRSRQEFFAEDDGYFFANWSALLSRTLRQTN